MSEAPEMPPTTTSHKWLVVPQYDPRTREPFLGLVCDGYPVCRVRDTDHATALVQLGEEIGPSGLVYFVVGGGVKRGRAKPDAA